jgi:hypothetical protein
MMNGLPPYGLNKPTAKALLKVLEKVEEKMNDPDLITSLKDQLFNIDVPSDDNRYKRTYSRKVSS